MCFPLRLEDLRLKLENQGYSNISYIIVNHQGSPSQLKHTHLKNHVSDQIAVYRQEEHQTDVWTLLNGNKDDFLIYDRWAPSQTLTHYLSTLSFTVGLFTAECHSSVSVSCDSLLLETLSVLILWHKLPCCFSPQLSSTSLTPPLSHSSSFTLSVYKFVLFRVI